MERCCSRYRWQYRFHTPARHRFSSPVSGLNHQCSPPAVPPNRFSLGGCHRLGAQPGDVLHRPDLCFPLCMWLPSLHAGAPKSLHPRSLHVPACHFVQRLIAIQLLLLCLSVRRVHRVYVQERPLVKMHDC
eukprot:1144077-Pelagomonas_calceolata.AAC.4